MIKSKVTFNCDNCGYETQKWLGKCPRCDEWNSFEEINAIKKKSTYQSQLKNISNFDSLKVIANSSTVSGRFFTKNKEFDRIFGDGITKDSVTLFGGEPGVGKSTLLLTVCRDLLINYSDFKILYVSGEETASQVRERCKRIGVTENLADRFFISHETNWQNILQCLKLLKPELLVIDSIQTITSHDILATAGSPSQVGEVTQALVSYAKANKITVFVVGHVTKDGILAGPKLLEHMVDTVLSFEGKPSSDTRELRPIKNRFGSTNQTSFFKINESGIEQIEDIAASFIDETNVETCGKVKSCIITGNRSIFVEVQSLVVENKFGSGKRAAHGVDLNRLALLVAIVEKFLELPLSSSDIYVNIAGGLKLKNPEVDLAIIASLLSSAQNKVINKGTVFLGEVALTGEVRSVSNVENLLKDIENYGFKTVITSLAIEKKFATFFKVQFFGISTISELDMVMQC